MNTSQVIAADLIWSGGAFRENWRIVVDERGVIAAAGPAEQVTDAPTTTLAGRALMPGMINAHSHAFQRGLRGRGESFPADAGSFWTWREAMYELVGRMDEGLMYELSHQAFTEMLAGGITTVGEFHYLHHDQRDAGYALDDVVLKAAADTGIRIVLLQAFYRTGDIGAPLEGGQRRFNTASVAEYWTQFDALAARCAEHQTLGVVAHSIRAAGLDDISVLHQRARDRGLVMHMHIEEQPREIESSIAAYGDTPLATLDQEIEFGHRFTAVHCTHTRSQDMGLLLDSGGIVCLCPLTEANLGDGLCDVSTVRRDHGVICIGTDSNARIDMFEEMRWLEYGQRLREQSRGIVRDRSGACAPALWDMATINGAASLGINAGEVQTGAWADFLTIDLDASPLRGWSTDALLTSLILGAGADVVNGRCVGGRWIEI